MPTTPDRPHAGSGQPTDPEQAHADARDTVALEIRARAGHPDHQETVRLATDRGKAATDRPAEARDMREPDGRDIREPDGDVAHRETVRVDPRPGDVANRETVRVPAQRGPRPAGRAPLLVAAAFATVWAALLSYVPLAALLGLAAALEGTGSPVAAARLGLAGWLLSHGVPLHTAGVGPLSLPPLLLTLLAAWRLMRAGVHVTRAMGARRTGSVRAAGLAAAAVAATYAALGVLAAVLVRGSGVTVPAPRAALTLGGFALVTALLGALRCAGALEVLALRVPQAVRHGIRTGLVAALLVLAVGAGLAGLSVALDGGHAAELLGAYRAGVAGQAGITVVTLAYAPNAAVWAAAYALGPGFSVGADTTVRLTEVVVGPLPAVPLLAGLPDGPVGGIGVVLLALPVAAAATAGALTARRLARAARPPTPAPGWPVLVGSGLLAGPVAGLVLGVAALLSGGSLGDGRLAGTGPVVWQVAAVAAAVLAAGAVTGAALYRAFGRGGRA